MRSFRVAGDNINNRGFYSRALKYTGGKTVHTRAFLNIPISQSKRLFPPNTDLSVRLKEAADAFRLVF